MEVNSNRQPIDLNQVRLRRFNLNDRLNKVIPFTKSPTSEAAISETNFDWQFYLSYYEDLQPLSTYQAAYEHWLVFGEVEGRIPNQAALEKYLERAKLQLPPEFDPEQYLDLNPDLQRRFEGHQYRKFRAIEHYLTSGKQEGRYYRSPRESRIEHFSIQKISEGENSHHSQIEVPQNSKPPCGLPLTNDDIYAQWLKENHPTEEDYRNMAEAAKQLWYKPLISIIMPTYNTPELFLREAIQAVQDQIYPYWELCIADDVSTQPHVRQILEEYAAVDSRIKLIFRKINGHISACSNSALTLATGEFIALLDHDDIITPDALYQIAALLNQHPEADMIYSDEDKLTEQGYRVHPFFKPDWCPDSFLSRMYTCHLGVYRRSIVKKIGGFRIGYEGSQDYDLVLRFTEHTDKIFHIPKILYHWRMHSASTAGSAAAKPYAYEAGARAIGDAIQRRGQFGRVISDPRFPGAYLVRYQIVDPKLVSIIIPTRNLSRVLDRCLQSIFEKSTYPHYEVLVIDNGSDEPELKALLDYWQQKEPDRFSSFELDIPFNYSTLNNCAVAKAKGDYLLFLNNDTEVITPDWIQALVEQVQRQEIGAVGALLLYPNDAVQHAGVVLGVGGVANHGHRHFSVNEPGYFSQLITINNYSAVTGACLMCRRSVFEQVGGFDEQLAVAYNDVDLCLKMVSQGYRNIYLPHVKLYHHESQSRGSDEETEKKFHRLKQESKLLRQRWGKYVNYDPCYSPNLTTEVENYELKLNHQALIEVRSVSLPQPLSGLCGFSIDSPDLGSSHANFLILKGWVIGKGSPAVIIEIIKNGELLRKIPVNVHRPDVAEHFRAFPEAIHSGFLDRLGVFEISSNVEIALFTLLENGERIHLITFALKVSVKENKLTIV